MPWRFSYKSLKFLPAAFSALHPVMQEPPWGASPGFVILLSGYISLYINAFASPAGSRSCINVLLQFSVFTVSTAALLGRKGSFLLCGHSWFLCGCWCRAEVFSFYPCGIIYTQREGKRLEYRTLCFMGVKCSVLSGSSLLLARCSVPCFLAVLSVLLLVSLMCTSTQRLQWTPVLLSWEVLLAPVVNYGQPQWVSAQRAGAGWAFFFRESFFPMFSTTVLNKM